MTNKDDFSVLPTTSLSSNSLSNQNMNNESVEPKHNSSPQLQDEYSLFQFWRQPIPQLLIDMPVHVTSDFNFEPDSCSSKKTKTCPIMENVDRTSSRRRTADCVCGDDMSGDDDIELPDEDIGGGDNSVFREGDGEGCEGDDYSGELTDIKDELLAGVEVGEDKGSQADTEGVVCNDRGTNNHQVHVCTCILVYTCTCTLITNT